MKLGDIVEKISGRREPSRVVARFADGKGDLWVVVRGLVVGNEAFEIHRESDVRVVVEAHHEDAK